VQAVERHISDSERISLTVAQPHRHALFLAAPGQGSGLPRALAVESANMTEEGLCRWEYRHGFLHAMSSCPEPSRRSSSAPPRTKDLAEAEGEEDGSQVHGARSLPVLGAIDSSPGSNDTSLTDSVLGSDQFLSSDEIVVSLPPKGQARTASSSEQAVGGDDEEPDDIGNKVENEVAAALSTLTRTRAAGLRSIGGWLHASGRCRICVHENNHQHRGKPPCFKGMLCDRCHELHEPWTRDKRKTAPGKNRRRSFGRRRGRERPGSFAELMGL